MKQLAAVFCLLFVQLFCCYKGVFAADLKNSLAEKTTFDCPITADAGADVTICACNTVPLNGSYSGNIGNITVTWTATPAVGNNWISDPHSLTPTVAIPCYFSGPLTFQLSVVSTNPACSATDAMTITVLAAPNVGTAIIQPTCTTPGSLTITGSGTVPPYTYLWDNGFTGTYMGNLTPGIYGITVTDGQGCTRSVSWLISGPTPPNPMVNNPTICGSGNTTMLTVTGGNYTSYAWSTGQTGNPITVSTPGTYTVTVTASNNCTGTAVSVVSALPSPTPSISATPFCSGSSATLTVSGGNYNPINWSNGQHSQSINITTGGNYTVTVTDENGCTASVTQNVAALPNPVPIITGPPGVCVNGSATLSVSGGNFNPVEWSTGQSGPSIVVTNQGTYTVTVTGSNGCTGTATRTLSSLPLPVPVINSPAGVCAGATAVLSVSGGNFSSIAWSTGQSGNSITVSNPDIYEVTVTDAAGCANSATRTLALLPPLSPAIIGPDAVCPGATATLSASGGAYTAYAWSSGQSSASIQVNQPDVYTVTVSNSAGCTGSAVQTISVFPEPSPAISGPGQICVGDVATLMVVGGPFSVYQWSAGGNGEEIYVSDPGTYTVTVTDANGCTGIDALAVSVAPVPAPVISGLFSFCAGGSTTLSVSGGVFTNYSWSGGQNGSSISVSNPGVYTVTVTNASGCTGAVSQNISTSPAPSPVISAANYLCAGNSTTISITGTYNTINWSNSQSGNAISISAPGVYTVTVTNAAGCTGSSSATILGDTIAQVQITGNTGICAQGGSTILNAGAFSQYLWSNTNTSASITVTSPGAYSVTVTDAAGCTATAAQTVTAIPNPTPLISGPASVCAGAATVLDAGAGFSAYVWSSGDTTQTITGTLSGIYTVSVSANNGCTGTANFTLTILPQLSADAGPGQYICPNQSAQLSASGGSNFQWSTGETTATITVNPGISSDYTVTVTAPGACPDIDTVRVNLLASSTTNVNPVICANANYTVGSTVFNQSNPGGSVVLSNVNGCDSTIFVNLGFHPLYQQQVQNFTCNPALAGIHTVQYQSQFGCDSTVTTTTVFNPNAIDTTLLTAHTCDPTLAGTKSVLLSGADGCDSLVITTTLLHPTPTLTLEKTTCSPGSAGTQTFVYQTQFGCDSTVIIHTVFDPDLIDTTQIISHSCDPANAGVKAVILSGSNGCDSVVITTTLLQASPTVYLFKKTCNPALVGTNTFLYQTSFGCDSTVVIQTNFDPNAADTTQLLAHTCDPALAGTVSVLLSNAGGCDSLVITHTFLHNAPTVTFQKSTCNPALVGTNTVVFQTPFGCDSTVITNTVFVPDATDTTQLQAFTCDPALAGTNSVLLSNSGGCDSLVITTTLLHPAPTVVLQQTTCDPALVGITSQIFQTAFGCDSTVFVNTTLLPSDTTFITQNTCDPTAAGVFSNPLQNQYGCDSLVITTVIYSAIDCNQFLAQMEGVGVSCFESSDGQILITVLSGIAPFHYYWQNTATGVSGSGTLPGLNQTEIIPGLTGGSYLVQVVPGAPPGEDTSAVFTVQVPFALSAEASITTDYQGFAISCPGAADGKALVAANGGTAPAQYLWSNGATTDAVANLAAGPISVTVTDAHGCVRIDSVLLQAPDPLEIEVQKSDERCAGDQNGVLQADWKTGGVLPLEFALNNGIFGATADWDHLAPGAYSVYAHDANGCPAAPVTVQIQPGPVFEIDAGLDTTLLSGDTLLLTILSSQPISTINWSPVESMLPVSPNSALVFPTYSTLYTLSAGDSNGCTARDDIFVKVTHKRRLYAPNVIHPDGTGNPNGVFTIFSGAGVQDIDLLRIYDRWGNMVFERHQFPPNDPAYGWNGDYGKVAGANGVYVFYAIVRLTDGTTEELSGDVTVLR